MNNDPASLANLNDIVLSSPPPWWPPAPGWYVLSGLLVVAIAWLTYGFWHRYRSNRYRRAAVAELALIEAEQGVHTASRLAALLKRTALHAYPREQVAALSGEQWHDFLDQHCASEPFKAEAGELLNILAYQPHELEKRDLQLLVNSIRTWIMQHRVEPC